MSLLKRLLHQEDFNRYFREGKLGTEFLQGFLEYINVTVDVEGEENIPSEGRFTFVSNHPLGMLETCAEAGFLAAKYDGRIAIPANDLMMSVKQVHEFMIPVNKLGGQSRELSGALDEAFASDKQMLYFPAGLCSRRIGGQIQDLPWKKSFITKSRKFGRDIVPIWFSGQNSKRVYRLDECCNAHSPVRAFPLPERPLQDGNREAHSLLDFYPRAFRCRVGRIRAGASICTQAELK